MPRTSSRSTACFLAVFLATAIGAGEEAPPNLVKNGGFEDGTAGWMWEQWANKALPGNLDDKQAKEGRHSFAMNEPAAEGGRWIAQEITLAEPERGHVLCFWLKSQELPAGAGRVRLAIKDRGFLSADGKQDLAAVSGTQDWKEYWAYVSPTALGGTKTVTLFVYHDQAAKGNLWIDGVALRPGSEMDLPNADRTAKLSADTSRPEHSTFALGEKVSVVFQAQRVPQAEEKQKLTYTVVDEHDTKIEERSVTVRPSAEGRWQGTLQMPSKRCGFYRVFASLSGGANIEKLGSREAGYVTYAIVPDPAKREFFGEKQSFYGMQGGFNSKWAPQIYRYLGIRWVLDDSFQWKRKEPARDKIGAAFDATPAAADDWKIFRLPTLFGAPEWAVKPETFAYMTGALTEEGEREWARYCASAAKAFAAKFPDREENIYQITWEPIRPWGYKGSDAQLARIYEIAHKALHEADPKAVVAGPCQGVDKNSPAMLTALMKSGLGKFLDAYTVHPYYTMPPEPDGFAERLRTMRKILREGAGRDIPMLGTEQGHATNEKRSEELEHARGLLRQNLIMQGEGYRVNFAYYIVDYRLSGQAGYGYYYTLVPEVPWAPEKISPKPIAPAYAAQSFLLEGKTSAGAIEWLGETAWGYSFARGDDVVLALWDFGKTPRTVALPTGVEQVTQYDWMGNGREVKTEQGRLSVELGPEPVYIRGVSPAMWGLGKRSLRVAETELTAYLGGETTVTAIVSSPPDAGVNGTLWLESDKRLGDGPMTRAVQVAKDSEQRYELVVKVPADAATGRAPVSLVLNVDGKDIAVTGASVRLVHPVSVAAVDPVETAGGVKAVAITLANQLKTAVAGKLHLKFPQLAVVEAALSYEIPSGESKRLVAELAALKVSPHQRCRYECTIETSAGVRSTSTGSVNFFSAPPMDTAPVIDGELNDWPAIGFKISGREAVVRNPELYKGEQDLAGEWRYACDGKALYIACAVTDDVFCQPQNGANTWQFDCLQLAFNLDPREKRSNTGNALADVASIRSSELNVALTPKGAEVCRSLTFAEDKLPTGLIAPEKIARTIRRTTTGVVYEIAIPWSELGALQPPKAGDLIGVAATINDADGEKQPDPKALGLFGGITPAKDPAQFGLMLIGNSK